MKSAHWSLLYIALLLALFGDMASRPAYAYIDPGTGSYVLQIVIGSMLAGAFVVRGFWQRIKLFAGSLFRGKSKDASE
jgi:H+/gluconate symporter-like permease